MVSSSRKGQSTIISMRFSSVSCCSGNYRGKAQHLSFMAAPIAPVVIIIIVPFSILG